MGYSVWLHSRTGARRSSGGLAVLVHERLKARVSRWSADKACPPSASSSPHHFWLRIEAPSLRKPLLLAPFYLPPPSSPYGLSSGELEDFFDRLADESARAAAERGGADVLWAADANGHMALLPDWSDDSVLLRSALPEEEADILLPCETEPPPRASCCTHDDCLQGRAVLAGCAAAGMLLLNGRTPGDMHGAPTCFTNPDRPSLIDILAAPADFLGQVASLHVLARLPESPLGHAPVELRLVGAGSSGGLDPAAGGGGSAAASAAVPSGNGGGLAGTCGPPPALAPPVRITADGLEAFPGALQQPGPAAQLQHLAATATDAPLAAAADLEALMSSTAEAVFPPARSRGGQPRRGSRLHHLCQPWFDDECAAMRLRLRQLLLEDVKRPGRLMSHLGRQAVRALGSKYRCLRQRKAAVWRRNRSRALLQLQRSNRAKLFKLLRRRQPGCPLPAATQLRHHMGVQLRDAFKRCGPRPPADLGDGAVAEPPSNATLDADVTEAEVAAAIRKLSASSSCLGPLRAVLIKAARDVVTPVLARLFTGLLRSGLFPANWSLGVITSIFKKGDPADPNNYRGITVGHVLGKLYAIVLNARLSPWLEAHGKRASGQAGFRPGFQTVDNCFILRALVERARTRGVRGMKLYTCAVDFEKAFDSAAREKLWVALQRAGIGGCMLKAIQSMYARVPVCVKSAEGLSDCFESVIGVKQGCPLSPLLFGVLIDDWETHMQSELGDAAALPFLTDLAGQLHRVPSLLFADDMLLISTSPAGLQAQLDCLQAYCDAKALTVNTAKTQVMVFKPGGGAGGKTAAADRFSYAGRPLETARSVKYLGLTFGQLSPKRGLASAADMLAAAGRKAYFAMRRRAWELGACSPETQSMLFDVFVKPVLSYGCEVWGVDLLPRTDCCSERVHRLFCRAVQGLPRQTSSAIALAELGRWPLHVHWIQQQARFWNRLLTLEPGRLLRLAFEDNLQLMQSGADLAARTSFACYTRRWFDYLQSAPTDDGTLVWLTPLREGDLLDRAVADYVARERVPAAPHSTSMFSHYMQQIRGGLPLGVMAPHLQEVEDPRLRISLSRFRAGQHSLRVHTERYLPPEIKAPRHQRTCLVCASHEVEDESHAVFVCPLYQGLRFEFADLFNPHLPQNLTSFLDQTQIRLALFVHKCSELRRRMRV